MKRACNSTAIDAQQGVVLLEALIAILIFAIGILGAVGLQASMIKANADARYRSEAGFVAEQRIAQMWVDQANLADYAELDPGTDIAADSGLPEARRTTIRGGGSCGGDLSCFLVTVSWKQPGADETHNVSAVARITGGT
jgi:type IV pilus assembly protein PilV